MSPRENRIPRRNIATLRRGRGAAERNIFLDENLRVTTVVVTVVVTEVVQWW
jgi:hypothetical protein